MMKKLVTRRVAAVAVAAAAAVAVPTLTVSQASAAAGPIRYAGKPYLSGGKVWAVGYIEAPTRTQTVRIKCELKRYSKGGFLLAPSWNRVADSGWFFHETKGSKAVVVSVAAKYGERYKLFCQSGLRGGMGSHSSPELYT